MEETQKHWIKKQIQKGYMLYYSIHTKFKEKLRYADRIQKAACLRKKAYWIRKEEQEELSGTIKMLYILT